MVPMTPNWSWIKPILVLAGILIATLAIGSLFRGRSEPPPDEWIVPFGYTGPVKIYYGVPTMPPAAINAQNGARRFEINDEGFLLTSSQRIVTDKPFARILMSKPDGSHDVLRWCYQNKKRFCTELTVTATEFQLDSKGINMFLVCEQGDACTKGLLSDQQRSEFAARFKETDTLVRKLTGMRPPKGSQ
jgi:hypothetical protein